jgi:hypothetical protein
MVRASSIELGTSLETAKRDCSTHAALCVCTLARVAFLDADETARGPWPLRACTTACSKRQRTRAVPAHNVTPIQLCI